MDEQQIIEEIANNAETLVPEVTETVAVVRNNPVLLAGVGFLGLAVGATVGYFATKKILTLRFEALLEDEMVNAKEYYSRLYKTDEYATPEGVVEALVPEEERESLREAVRKTRVYRRESVDIESDEPVVSTRVEVEEEVVESDEPAKVHNIFKDGDPINLDDFDYDTEVAQRSEDHPYVITKEEFYENEPDFVQAAVTFYEADGVLADEADQPIDDIEGNVGEENLNRFGHGSQDRRTVYVRNNKRGLDYEITQHMGSFAEVVHGLHSDDEEPPRRRMRASDD